MGTRAGSRVGARRDPFARVLEQVAGCREGLTLSGIDREECETLGILIESVRAWAASKLNPGVIDTEESISSGILRSAAELGLLGITIPREYGGGGLSMKAASAVIEELARFDRSVAVSIGLHCGLGVRGLVQYGSEALRRELLPELARGHKIAAFAATEPGAGSDIPAIRTTGVWDGGDTLRVSGSKTYITNGGFADVFTVVAQTPGLGGRRRGHSLLLVHRGTQGLSVGKEEKKLGIRGSSTTPIELTDVPVPLSNVIGEPCRGLSQLQDILSWGRTLMAAGCLGGARECYARALRHVVTRKQFGRSLGFFGLVQEKIAAMRAMQYAMESLLRLAGELEQRDGSDILWESAVAKVFCSEAAWVAADDAVQLHGGSGFIEATGVPCLLRDARIPRIFEGSNEVLRFHLAAGALSRNLAAEPKLAPLVSPVLRSKAGYFDALREALSAGLAALAVKVGARVMEHQLLLAPFTEGLVALYALLAVLLRTDGLLRQGAEAGQELGLTRYLAIVLGRRAEEALARSELDTEEDLIGTICEREYQIAP